MTAIEFDRVSRDFAAPDGRSYRALDDISFTVSAGAFVAIVGPSGCGKSTLLNIAAGLLAPSAGRVRVDGEALAGLNRRATYMFQQDALLPWKTVRDNVALGLTLGGVARPVAHARAAEWLGRVGLAGFGEHYPAQLSGGMRKRAAMAQHWIIDRGLMLMDEPFSALDVIRACAWKPSCWRSGRYARLKASRSTRRAGNGERPSSSSRTISKRRSRSPTRSSSSRPDRPRASSRATR
jgi:NitT/TauT family transport system ATP-binding protein